MVLWLLEQVIIPAQHPCLYRSKPALKPNTSSAKKGSPTSAVPGWALPVGSSLECTCPGAGMQILFNSCRLPWGWMRTLQLKGDRQVSRTPAEVSKTSAFSFPQERCEGCYPGSLFPRDTWSLKSCSQTADHQRLHRAEFPGRPAWEGHHQRGGFPSEQLCSACCTWWGAAGHSSDGSSQSGSVPFAGTALICPVPGWLQQGLEKQPPRHQRKPVVVSGLGLNNPKSVLVATGFLPGFQQAVPGQMKLAPHRKTQMTGDVFGPCKPASMK